MAEGSSVGEIIATASDVGAGDSLPQAAKASTTKSNINLNLNSIKLGPKRLVDIKPLIFSVYGCIDIL